MRILPRLRPGWVPPNQQVPPEGPQWDSYIAGLHLSRVSKSQGASYLNRHFKISAGPYRQDPSVRKT